MGFSYSVIIDNIMFDFNLLYVVYLLFSFSCPFFLPVNDKDRVREREKEFRDGYTSYMYYSK